MRFGYRVALVAPALFLFAGTKAEAGPPHPALAVGIGCYSCHPAIPGFLPTSRTGPAVEQASRPSPDTKLVGPVSRVEADLLAAFPSLGERIASRTSLETATEAVGGRSVSGLRVAAGAGTDDAPPGRPVFLLPDRYDEPFVARTSRQRVALRVLGAGPAPAEAAGGHVVYAGAHEGVDSLHVPRETGTEEILLLRTEAAPRAFDYEVVEMRGVSGVALLDGAVRFLSERGPSRGLVPVGGTIEIARPWVVDARGVRSESAARWEILRGGPDSPDSPVRLRLVVDPSGLAYPLAVDPSFTITGTMSTVRGDHSATLLGSGKVLIAGGLVTLNDATATAELYDPATGRFSPTGSLGTARYWHGASILPTGKVLLAGGFGTTHLSSAELYDPATGTFAPTGPMTTPRAFPLTVLLASGKVLVAGGFNGTYLSTAELYDPATGTFSPTGSMTSARFWATATRLKDGRVLVAGGFTGAEHLGTAEIYNPATGTFTAVAAPMKSPRSSHSAALLPDGTVLLARGFTGSADVALAYPATAELFDPATATFVAAGPLAWGSFKSYATVLPIGNCLLAGGVFAGFGNGGLEADSLKTEIFDAVLKTSAESGAVHTARRLRASATLLPSGAVLFVGGFGHSFVLQSNAEEYRYEDPLFYPLPSVPPGLGQPTVTLADGRIAFLTSPTASILNETGTTFTPSALDYAPERATLLADGRVLLSGQFPDGNLVLWNPATGVTTPTGLVPGPRDGFTATLLRSGRVLFAGGGNRLGNATRVATVYDPATGSLNPVGRMNVARASHVATLLEDGRVLVTGGNDETVRHASAEIFDPVTGSFTLLPRTMAWPRQNHQATLLPGGRVLITGGNKGLSSTATAELFDPSSSSFSLLPEVMSSPRDGHSATLLPSGRVLIAGGRNYPATPSAVPTVEIFDPVTGMFQPPIAQPAGMAGTAAGSLYDGAVLLFDGNLAKATVLDEYLGYGLPRRPVVTSATTPLVQPAPLALAGTGFKAPVVRLQRVEGDRRVYLLPDPALRWSDSSFTSLPLAGLPAGFYRATVFADAVPNLQKLVAVPAWDPAAPSIVGQPQPQTVLPGGSATLSVVAVGEPTLSYQWAVETTPGVFSPVGGAAASSLVTGPLASRAAYRVTVSNGSGTVTSVPAVVSISSDLCANATTIGSVPYVGTQTTTAATAGAADPVPPCGAGIQSNSVFYRYTPTTDGVLTAQTFESDYDTILSAWTGSCGSFAPVAGGCSDDFISERSLVSFPVKAGTTYTFMVSAKYADGGNLVLALDLAPTPSSFYTVPPCRVLDTRLANGPLGGPNLLPPPAADRVFPILSSACGIPAGARALAVNVTVAGPSAAGFLTLYPAGLAAPAASTVNFGAGKVRANNAIVALSSDGLGNLAVKNGSTGTVPFLLDVVGYFR